MKEYALFVKPNGDADMYCGGQFAFFAHEGSVEASVAKLWKLLDEAGEVFTEIRETGVNRLSDERTYVVKTRPKELPKPEPENCREGRCGHPKNFVGSCMVYLTQHPPKRACRD